MLHLRLFCRAFLIVALTSWNVRHIAALNYTLAVMGGWCISFVWWENARSTREDARWAREAYATGAAFGTLAGMWLARG